MNLKIALAQLSPKLGDKEYNLQLIERGMGSAKEEGANMIVFPELFLTGYSVGTQLTELAENIDGSSLKKIKVWCKKYSIFSVISFPERGDNGNYYISSALISDRGEVEGVYRKTHLFDEEKQYFSAGNDFRVIHTPYGKVGLMICFDVEFPEIARSLKLNGADMIIITNANMEPYGEYHYIYAKSRAMENEVPLVICNRVGQEGELVFCGDSMVIDEKGNELLHLKRDEIIKTVEVQLNSKGDHRLNYIENRREDLYINLLE